MNTSPIPSAQPIVWGLGLTLVGAPGLFWLGLAVNAPGLFTLLAALAGVTGLGLFLYGLYAFLTSFDAVAARYLARTPAAAGDATPSSSRPAPAAPVLTSSTPLPTYSRTPRRSPSKQRGPTASDLLAGPPGTKGDASPAPPRKDVRIVVTPPPPPDDDA